MSNNLIWYGPPYSYSGYAQHNRAMIFELHKLGWNIQLIPTENSPPEHLIGKDLLLELTKTPHLNREETVCINLIPPPAIGCFSAYTILFTTIESLTVHQGFFRRCSQYDEVWLPCKENVKSMLAAGFPRHKLFHCQEGVHPLIWTPETSPYPKYWSKLFTFFYNGDWSYRKGIDTLITSYAKAFTPTDPVRLLLLVHYQGNGAEKSRQRIITELQEICHKNNIYKLPRIEFIFEHIPDPMLPEVYRCADVYVSPTRGEAWGLPIIQAMSCGIPAIVPNWGGQMDYCNSKNSFLIDTLNFDIIDDKVNLTVDFYREQLFCSPDQNHFTSLLRYAYDHPNEVQRKGKRAREEVSKYFTWERAGKRADKRLRKIYETGLG